MPTCVSLDLCLHLVWTLVRYLFLRWACVCAGVHPSDHWAGTTTCWYYNTPLLYVTTLPNGNHYSVTLSSFSYLLLTAAQAQSGSWEVLETRGPWVRGRNTPGTGHQSTAGCTFECTVRGDSGSLVCMLWECGMKSERLGKTDTEKPKMIWYWRVQFFLVRRWKSTVYPGNLVHRMAASLVVSDLFVWNSQWTINLSRQSLWIIKLYP